MKTLKIEMRAMNALEVKEDGTIWLIVDAPEEPKYTDYVQHTKYYWQVNKFERAKRNYEKKIASAERLLVGNQEVAQKILYPLTKHKINASFGEWKAEGIKPGIYPIPGLKFEMKEACANDSCPVDTSCEHCQKPVNVAIVSLPESDSTKHAHTESTTESQEELWSAVEDIVEDKIGTYYPDLPTGQLTFNIVEALKEQFTMTRKL